MVQRVDLKHPHSKPPAGDIAQVRVMREEQHLGLAAEIVKHAQRRPRPFVVVVDQQIVGDEGNRLGTGHVKLDRGDAQRQEKLIAGPVRWPDMMMLSSAKTWRFKPALKDGRSVRYRLLLDWTVTPR